MKKIQEIAKKYSIDIDDLEFYGNYKAKLTRDFLNKNIYGKSVENHKKLVLVTAINPTPAGEGKTTISISLTDGLNYIGKKAVVALREPSLGPCFGMKGGASGGGKATIEPSTDLNLHFTGDFHAITTANNLISAVLDNYIHQGNTLNIDPKNILWKRCLDMNDRVLRQTVVALGSATNGVMRQDGFMITVASEIMAILCLATDLQDLRRRLDKVIVAYTYDKQPVTVADLQITGALMAILLEATKPNLIQTAEGNLAVVHGGPFANIAHGCNSIVATKTALKLGDYAVTEAGFGADLGAEKFFDIKCRKNGIKPNAVVIVATVRALKYNGSVPVDKLEEENIEAIKSGIVNLQRHIRNMKSFGVQVCVAINKFATDTEAEINTIKQLCNDTEVVVCEGFTKGAAGSAELAETVVKLCQNSTDELSYPYQLDESIESKIHSLTTKFYGAKNVEFSSAAQKAIKEIEKLSVADLPICMAKTPYSFSDDPKLLGAPKDFTVHVSTIRLSAGAEMIVAETGNIMTMPGLPKNPVALKIDIDENDNIIAPW